MNLLAPQLLLLIAAFILTLLNVSNPPKYPLWIPFMFVLFILFLTLVGHRF